MTRKNLRHEPLSSIMMLVPVAHMHVRMDIYVVIGYIGGRVMLLGPDVHDEPAMGHGIGEPASREKEEKTKDASHMELGKRIPAPSSSKIHSNPTFERYSFGPSAMGLEVGLSSACKVPASHGFMVGQGRGDHKIVSKLRISIGQRPGRGEIFEGSHSRIGDCGGVSAGLESCIGRETGRNSCTGDVNHIFISAKRRIYNRDSLR